MYEEVIEMVGRCLKDTAGQVRRYKAPFSQGFETAFEQPYQGYRNTRKSVMLL